MQVCQFTISTNNDIIIVMKDGLYRVVTKYLVAGFVLKDDKIIHCAPILNKKIKYWKTIAEWIGV